MEVSAEGGLDQFLQKIFEAQDKKEILGFFKEFILKAYGEKDPDGVHFVKSPELTLKFSQTEAYVSLFMSMIGDEQVAATFFNGVIPQDMLQAALAANAAKKEN